MPTAREETTQMARILSSEQFPKQPTLGGKDTNTELRRFFQQLEVYLRKIYGRFTATNLTTTIITGGDGTVDALSAWRIAYVKYWKIKQNIVNDYLVDSNDWRGRVLMADSLALTESSYATGPWNEGSGRFLAFQAGYNQAADLTLTGGPLGAVGNYTLYVEATTGHLRLDVNSVGNAEYAHLKLAIFGGNRYTTSQDVIKDL